MYRRLSILLAVVMLAGLLVAFTPGDDPEAKATLGPLQAVTVSAAEFVPGMDGQDFDSLGFALRGSGSFYARVPFPVETVVITTVRVRFYDSDPATLCVNLYRVRPAGATQDDYGGDCHDGTSPSVPETFSFPVFERVGKYHTAVLKVDFSENSTSLQLYGATVFYRVVT